MPESESGASGPLRAFFFYANHHGGPVFTAAPYGYVVVQPDLVLITKLLVGGIVRRAQIFVHQTHLFSCYRMPLSRQGLEAGGECCPLPNGAFNSPNSPAQRVALTEDNLAAFLGLPLPRGFQITASHFVLLPQRAPLAPLWPLRVPTRTTTPSFTVLLAGEPFFPFSLYFRKNEIPFFSLYLDR